MNNTMAGVMMEPVNTTAHRYQVYRQAKNGVHYSHGAVIESPEEAVALFLQTQPAFEGGSLRLWDHFETRNVASAEWHTATTRMGFTVRSRSNLFHDPAIAVVARQIAERNELAQSISAQIG